MLNIGGPLDHVYPLAHVYGCLLFLFSPGFECGREDDPHNKVYILTLLFVYL